MIYWNFIQVWRRALIPTCPNPLVGKCKSLCMCMLNMQGYWLVSNRNWEYWYMWIFYKLFGIPKYKTLSRVLLLDLSLFPNAMSWNWSNICAINYAWWDHFWKLYPLMYGLTIISLLRTLLPLSQYWGISTLLFFITISMSTTELIFQLRT